jgi:hypothetical protein
MLRNVLACKFYAFLLPFYLALNFKDTKKVKEEEMAIDKGGPTRQFFSQFWEQIGLIEVEHHEHKIRLFDCKRDSFFPRSNENLNEDIENATKGESMESIASLNDQIDQYYRAVGVVLFRAIIGQHPIATKVMPRFLRNGEFHNAGVGKCLLYVHVSRIKQFYSSRQSY